MQSVTVRSDIFQSEVAARIQIFYQRKVFDKFVGIYLQNIFMLCTIS